MYDGLKSRESILMNDIRAHPSLQVKWNHYERADGVLIQRSRQAHAVTDAEVSRRALNRNVLCTWEGFV